VALKVLSFLPVVGVLVFPAAEFHQLYRSYGLWTAFWALLFQNSIVALGLFQISSQFVRFPVFLQSRPYWPLHRNVDHIRPQSLNVDDARISRAALYADAAR